MKRVLFSWVGVTDIKLSWDDRHGPLAATLVSKALDLEGVVLLRNPAPDHEFFAPGILDAYGKWLGGLAGVDVEAHDVPLDQPMHFGQIYEGVKDVLERTLQAGTEPTFNLSSGTSAMAAVWLLIGRGVHRARLTHSSREAGVQVADFPFDIFTDFIPDVLKASERTLSDLGAGAAAGAFDDIIYRSEVMDQLLGRARRAAQSDAPVLIMGESGTGKELFARGIHAASGRASAPFVVVNCGAIPEQLVESTLFGHVKGAFTGADRRSEGLFGAAHEGTLFLDELGELPLAAQAKLLRVLQSGEVMPVGATSARKVNVRVIAATHRDLARQAAAGEFRDDLYYRLAVAVLRIPPLRERRGDLGALITELLDRVSRAAAPRTGVARLTLTAGARKKLMGHDWPGNIRELQNTLTRAVLFAEGSRITADEIELLSVRQEQDAGVLGRPLGEGFEVKELLDEVRRHYLERALRETRGRKSEAGALIGIGRQSVSDWMKQLGVELQPE